MGAFAYIGQAPMSAKKRPPIPDAVAQVFFLSLYRALTSPTVEDARASGEGFAMETSQNGRARNEDRCFIARYHCGKDSFVFAGVMDGVGEGKNGGACCDLAIAAMISRMICSGLSGKARIVHAVASANETVMNHFNGAGSNTVVSVVADSKGVYAATAGDSFLFAGVPHRKLSLISRIDTVGADMLRGDIVPSEANAKCADAVTQYIGKPYDFIPHIAHVAHADTARFVAASDGVTPVFEDAHEHPKAVVSRVMATQRPHGDNATALCLDNIVGMQREAEKGRDHFIEVTFPYAMIRVEDAA